MTFAFRLHEMMATETKILVIEAEERERSVLVGILGRDYDVRGASCGREALEFLGAEPFGLVLVGATGGDRDREAVFTGLACSRLRPKVILLTPNWSPEILSRAAEYGADGVLTSRDAGEVAASVAAHLRS